MNAPQIISDIERKVKDALEVWADFMRHSSNRMGYPSRSTGFIGGGSLSNFEDMEYACDVAMAQAINAIMEGMTVSQSVAVNHYHLGAVWRSNRTNLSDDYAQALVIIERGLKKRGLI